MNFRQFVDALEDALGKSKRRNGKCQVTTLLDQVFESTSAGINSSLLTDLCRRTDYPYEYLLIYQRIWSNLENQRSSIGILKKTLILLDYLIVNGNIRMSLDVAENKKEILKKLAFQYNCEECLMYEFSKDMDFGAGIRRIAKSIYEMITNSTALQEKRLIAQRLQQKLIENGKSRGPDSPHRPPVYHDNSSKCGVVWDFGGPDHICHDKMPTHSLMESNDLRISSSFSSKYNDSFTEASSRSLSHCPTMDCSSEDNIASPLLYLS